MAWSQRDIYVSGQCWEKDVAFSFEKRLTVCLTFPQTCSDIPRQSISPRSENNGLEVRCSITDASLILSTTSQRPHVRRKQPGNKDIYKRLLKQCQNLHIPTLSSAEEFTSHYNSSTDLVLDTIFGFSFHPPVRSPFDAVLRTIAQPSQGKDKRVPIVSIDIPSGWSVEDGAQKLQDEQGGDVPTFEPEVLLSLTCPKVGVKGFKGRHFLGGRFIPEYVNCDVTVKWRQE